MWRLRLNLRRFLWSFHSCFYLWVSYCNHQACTEGKDDKKCLVDVLQAGVDMGSLPLSTPGNQMQGQHASSAPWKVLYCKMPVIMTQLLDMRLLLPKIMHRIPVFCTSSISQCRALKGNCRTPLHPLPVSGSALLIACALEGSYCASERHCRIPMWRKEWQDLFLRCSLDAVDWMMVVCGLDLWEAAPSRPVSCWSPVALSGGGGPLAVAELVPGSCCPHA